MYAIQGAMAVRRERNKRRARRISQLRRGSQSGSLYSVVLEEEEEDRLPPKTSSSLTAFHIGVVFILLGFIMIFSSLIGTNNLANDLGYGEEERAQHVSDWSKLLGVGVTFIIIGLLMVMVNRIITAREEEELEEYVKRRLARTRSGHALVRDAEHYPRRLSTTLQAPGRRGSAAAVKSPRGSGKGPRRTNGSFYSQVPRGSNRASLKEQRTSHSVVSTEQEGKAGGESALKDPSSLPSPSVSYNNDLSEPRDAEEGLTPSRRDKLRSSRRKRRQD